MRSMEDPDKTVHIENPVEYLEFFERLLELNEPVDTSIEIEKKNGILFKPAAYLAMVKHSWKFGSPEMPQHKRREVIGLLSGRLINQNTPIEQIVVHKYWPIGVGDGVSVNILSAEPVMKVYQNLAKGQFIVGWAHSHPGYTPFMSVDDIETHSRYTALWEPSIAAVIDPTMISKMDYGFKVFRLTKNRAHYYDLPFEVEGMSSEASYDVLGLVNGDTLE